MHGARLGQQAHDRAKHLVELERRRDGRDDLGEEVALGANAHGDERTEAGDRSPVLRRSATSPAAASASAPRPQAATPPQPARSQASPGQVGAERAEAVVRAEVQGARRAAIRARNVTDAELRSGVAGEGCGRDAPEPDDDRRQGAREGQQDADGRHDDGARGEPPPAVALGDPAGQRARHAHDPEQEHEACGRQRQVEGWVLQPVNDISERPHEREEEGAPDRCHRDERQGDDATQRLVAPGGRPGIDEPSPHRDGGGERKDGQRGARSAPPDEPGGKGDPDPADEATAGEGTDVPPHHALADSRHERLDDVRRSDHEQARHAEALKRAADEEEREGRCQRNPEGRRHEEPARQPDRARPADPIGERPPEPGSDREGEHGGRDGQTGLRRPDVELARELGEDRLRRVHRGEHPCRTEQKAHHSGLVPLRLQPRACPRVSAVRQHRDGARAPRFQRSRRSARSRSAAPRHSRSSAARGESRHPAGSRRGSPAR